MANALVRTGYSATQLALHWLIALLLVLNTFVTGEDMGSAWRANERGDATQLSGLVPQLHLWFGLAILAFAVWRVFLRQTRGVPEAPAEESAVLRMAAHVTHILLYALMLAIPLTGVAVYYLGIGIAGDVHQILRWPLILLVVLHVGGALYQRFVLKSNVLTRIVRPEA